MKRSLFFALACVFSSCGSVKLSPQKPTSQNYVTLTIEAHSGDKIPYVGTWYVEDTTKTADFIIQHFKLK